MDIFSKLYPVFGFQIATDKVCWEKILYRISPQKDQYYIFNRKSLEDMLEEKDLAVIQSRITAKFIELTNSDALITISQEITDEFLTSNHLIYHTDRPFIRVGSYDMVKTVDLLLEKLGVSASVYYSPYISGSWKKSNNLVFSLPFAVDFKTGKTVYEYEENGFSTLKSVIGSRVENPERLTVYDGEEDSDIQRQFRIDLSQHPIKYTEFNGNLIDFSTRLPYTFDQNI